MKGIFSTGLRFADGADDGDLLDILMFPFYGPAELGRRDLYHEFFSPRTDLCLRWFEQRPLLYHHGRDGAIKTDPIGVVLPGLRTTDVGHWAQAQLDASSDYHDAIKDLIRKRKLYASSGAMQHLVETDKKTGEILVWPWVEGSTTVSPANYLADVSFADARKYFSLSGLRFTPPPHARAALRQVPEHPHDDWNHEHEHADGQVHSHLHTHDDGSDGHDTSAHAHVAQVGGSPMPGHPHDEGVAHAHVHDDGTTHTHVHGHTDGSIDHDTADHDHSMLPQSNSPTPAEPVGDQAAGETPPKGSKSAAARAVSYEQIGKDVAQRARQLFDQPDDDDADDDAPRGPAATWCYPVATYADAVVVCYSDQDGDADDGDYFYRVPYGRTADGHVSEIGAPVLVDPEWSPRTLAGPLVGVAADSLHSVFCARRAIAQFQRHTKGLLERRLAQSRGLSTKNLDALDLLIDGLDRQARAFGDALVALRADRERSSTADAAAKAAPSGVAEASELLQRARAFLFLSDDAPA